MLTGNQTGSTDFAKWNKKDQKWYFVFSKTLLFFFPNLLGWKGEYNIFVSCIENFLVRKRLKVLHGVEAGGESNRFFERERENGIWQSETYGRMVIVN